MRELAERVEAVPCPACGRESLSFFQDEIGAGAQCSALDCLEFFEIEELIEAAE